MRIAKCIRAKIKSKLGIALDVGCGENPQPYFLGMDKRRVPGVDILHDAEVFPWPLPDSICNKILCSHIYEHIKPWLSIDFMNECWRVMKPGGQLLISTPYATSHGYFQDPTHCNPANESCVTPDTEVLTYQGFKKIVDIEKSDRVLSLNPDTKYAEYVEDCRLVTYNHDGNMVHFKGRAIDLLTNGNHRVWYATRKTADRFRLTEAKDFLKKNPKTTIFSNGIKYKGEKISEWIIPFLKSNPGRAKIKDTFDAITFAEFMGWYLSEGSVEVTKKQPSYYRVHISQTNKENRKKIYDVIERLGFHPIENKTDISFSAFTLSQWLKQFGHCEDKFIPRKLLNAQKPVLEALFKTLMLGDGHKSVGTQISYKSLSKQLADDVQELMLKIGYRASINNSKTKEGKIVYRVCGSEYSPIYAREFKEVNYKGTVHSLIMPKNHIYMARRNNKCVWTGNTWTYFDPAHFLWKIYKPKPWKIIRNAFIMIGNMEVILEKRTLAEIEGVLNVQKINVKDKKKKK